MCSIAIPSDLLLGHSSPVYGSLFYNSLMVTTPPITNKSVPPQIRPCLASGSLHFDNLLKSNDSTICNKKNKKRVVFADDHGRPLTQVRIMSEPSNMPPLWTGSYIASLAYGNFFRNVDAKFIEPQQSKAKAYSCSNVEMQYPFNFKNICSWKPIFVQPASNYLAFRNKLDKDSVSLENIIIHDIENCLIGTVKVKNLAYDKDVTIRLTNDNWKTHDDISCVYVEQPPLIAQAVVRNLYDTFRFCIPLPVVDGNICQIEFCVHYTIDGSDFWDNNAGTNYVIKKNRNVNPNDKFNTTTG